MKRLNEVRLALEFKKIATKFLESDTVQFLWWIQLNTLTHRVANMYFLDKVSKSFYDTYMEGVTAIRKKYGKN